MSKIKKTVMFVLSAFLLLSLFTACGEKTATGAAATQSADAATQSAAATAQPTAAATQQADEKFVVSMAITDTNDSPAGHGIDFFKERVYEYSGGTIEVECFYNSQLGDNKASVAGVQQGTIDFNVAGNSYLTTIVPELQVFELPFIFDDIEQAREIVRGDVGQTLAENFEGSGIKVLEFGEIGMREMTCKTHQINSIEDVKGLKIRTLPASVQVKAWELFGAVPTAIDFSELYTSLQLGVVDAQENPLTVIVSSKLYEPQKYLSMTNHVYSPSALIVSEKTWAKFSPGQQEAVMKAASEAIDSMLGENDALTNENLEFLQEQGIEINMNPDTSGFKAIAPQAYDIFTDDYGSELIDMINANKS